MALFDNMPYTNLHELNLDWVIQQIQQFGSTIAGLDDRITEKITSLLGTSNPLYYSTAADLINSSQAADTLAVIEGYYAAEDGGGNLYYITSDPNVVLNAPFNIALSDNRWAIPIILANRITPRMFGAYGDDEHDDTDALNLTFINAFKYHKNVYIDAGIYRTTGAVIYGAAYSGDEFSPVITGAGRYAARLRHTGNGVAVSVRPYENVNYLNGITLSSFSIIGNDNTTIGLELSSGTRYNVEKISIKHASSYGLRGAANIWISSFVEIYVDDCPTGMSLRGSANTSLYINECYMNDCTYRAYDLQGSYSDIGVLAADGCTGENVYYFYGFTGSIGALGAEDCNVHDLIYFQGSRCDIGAINSVRLVTDGALRYPIYVHTSRISVTNANFYVGTAATIDKPLAYLYSGVLDVDNVTGEQTFGAIVATSAGANSFYSYHGTKFKPHTGTPGRSYVGVDRSLGAGLWPAAYNNGVAIILDTSSAPRYSADGTDHRWDLRSKKGDWFIENDPRAYGAAAYVMLEDGGNDANSFNFGFIPVIKSGATANRPDTASLKRGSMYFDTTLGKPIWYNGSGKWIDATGANV